MRAIEMFVRRPVIAIVVNLALVLIGLRAVTQLPIQQYPRIESSSIVITTVYVGASADSIRGFVTTPIERAVSSITGIDYVESSSVAGLSTVTARLKLNHPSTVALAEVGNRMDQIRSELPQEIESPNIEVQRADRPLRDVLRQRHVGNDDAAEDHRLSLAQYPAAPFDHSERAACRPRRLAPAGHAHLARCGSPCGFRPRRE